LPKLYMFYFIIGLLVLMWIDIWFWRYYHFW